MQCLNHSSCSGNEVYYYDIVIESLELLISDQCKKILTLVYMYIRTYVKQILKNQNTATCLALCSVTRRSPLWSIARP